jgi:hypothetical protein
MEVPGRQFTYRLLAWFLLFKNLIKVPLAKIATARYRPAKETGHIVLLIWNTLT